MEDLDWKRRSDARTLAEAEEIKADKERYRGAIKGAKQIAKEELQRFNGLSKVAGVKLPKDNFEESDNTVAIPNGTRPFNKRGYKNPATIGKF